MRPECSDRRSGPIVRAICAALVILWVVVDLRAQQRPAEPFRSGRTLLTIDASVTSASDTPIADLTAEDFSVRIDGEARQVLTVRRYASEAPALVGNTVPIASFTRAAEAAPGRVVVIVIDRTSIKAGSERSALETVSALLASLSPADAVAAIGLPGGSVDLTRDHGVVADAVRKMTGMQPRPDWEHFMTWDEALAYEKEDRLTIARVVERECQNIKRGPRDPPDPCPPDLVRQARQMLLQGRAQGQATLIALTNLLGRLTPLHAPKRMVIVSGGLVFDVDLYGRYRQLAQRAAESHVALSLVHLDQDLDAADRGHWSNVFGGREYATGLGTVASMTGGSFYMGVGRATGVFQRIASEITNFYELGLESRPSDADGKAHRVDVKVAREGAKVRAPSETAVARPAAAAADALASALAEPTDVAELPLEIATYTTHSRDAEKVAVIVAAQLAPAVSIPPAEWGYAILDGDKIVGGSKVRVGQGTSVPWSASAKIEIPPGRYRLRAAAIAADGRIGALDLPLRVGLRQAGAAYASDLIVGSSEQGKLQPRARLRQDEPGLGMIELSSPEPLTDIAGEIVLTRAGTQEPAARPPLKLRAREDDQSIVVAEARLDLTSLAPGSYTASAVLKKEGAPIARVSRGFEILPGATTTAPVDAARAAAPATTRDSGVEETMRRVGGYVERFGTQASVLVAIERYEQNSSEAVGTTVIYGARQPARGAPTSTVRAAVPDLQRTAKKLVAEVALVRNEAAAGGWLAFRDVIEVDGKPVPDRRDRLQALFRSDRADLEAAKRITAESARFNVGPVTRTFNIPTAALFFFHSGNLPRFAFKRAGTDRIDGVEVTKIDFEETRRPSLIMTSAGNDVLSSGTLWIDPADDSVLRTRLVLAQYRGARSHAEVEVVYRRDAALGMLVPVRMTEHYITPTASITGNATYSDFKRFETSTKIK